MNCKYCDQEIVWHTEVHNKVTGAYGYWRDTGIADTCCDTAPDNGHGQYLHEPAGRKL